ncbi:unnamed protein product, partial [Symbiodinium microadriaticum]
MPTTPRQWIHSYVRLPLVGTKVTVRAPAHLRTYTSRSPSYGLLHRRLLPRWVSWDSEQHQEVPVHIGSACLYGSGMHALQLLRRLPTAQREHGYPRGQVYNQPGSTNVLVPLSSFRRGELWLLEEHVLEFDPLTKHATCPWKAPEIIAYTILEVTFDLRTLVHLAQTNKATWIRCSQVLRATSTECKIQANAPWHKRAGRAVDGNAMETPIDIKMYLFNKRMHTWYHHELSYQQYMDLQASVTVRHVFSCPVSYHSHMVSVAATTLPETMDAAVPTTPPSDSSTFDYSDDGRHDAAEQVLTNATLLKTILKFHTELRVRTVAVSVEHTPIARHANQAVQSAMDAIVQQHPQAHHTTVI